MAKSQHRQIITLKSSASAHTYTSTKNKNNTKDRLEIVKYDPVVRKRVKYKEDKK